MANWNARCPHCCSVAANECNDTLVSRAKELKDPKVKPVFRSRLAWFMEHRKPPTLLLSNSKRYSAHTQTLLLQDFFPPLVDSITTQKMVGNFSILSCQMFFSTLQSCRAFRNSIWENKGVHAASNLIQEKDLFYANLISFIIAHLKENFVVNIIVQ